MPDRLAWTTHAHGQGQQCEFYSTLRKLRKQQLIAADPREVIDVAWLGHPDAGIDQQACFYLLGCAESQLDVSAMHWVACLKCNDPVPSQQRFNSAREQQQQEGLVLFDILAILEL